MKSSEERKALVLKYLQGQELIPMTQKETRLHCMDLCVPSVIWWVGEKDSDITIHLGSTLFEDDKVQISIMGVEEADAAIDETDSELCFFDIPCDTIESAIYAAKEFYGIELSVKREFIEFRNSWLAED